MVGDSAVPEVLPRLTALRTFAAFFVLCYHLEAYNVFLDQRAPFTLGYTGVAFFFILSGFVLTWSAKPGARAREIYYRRFARIYPLYLAVLAIAYVVPYSPAPPHRGLWPSLLSLSLLQAWIPKFTYSVNPPSWSLSCEAFFYAMLPLLLWTMHKVSRRTFFTVGSVWVVATAVCGALLATASSAWTTVVYPIGSPVLRSGEFVLGMMCATALRDGRRLPLPVAAVVVAAFVAIVAAFPSPSPIPQIELELVFAVVIVRCAQADIGGRRGLLTLRGLVYAGNVSYAFYLIHPMVLVSIQHFLGDGVGPAATIFGVCAIGAVFLHEGVERPAQRALLRRRQARLVAARTAPRVGSLAAVTVARPVTVDVTRGSSS